MAEDFKGELDDVFNDSVDKPESEKTEFDRIVDGESNKVVRYLKNIGQPSKIVVFMQKSISWIDKAGRQLKVEIVTNSNEEENVKKRRQYGIILGEGQKAYINFINGVFQRTKVVYEDHSFIDWNYPHIIGFPVGTNMANRRVYDLYINEAITVELDTDAEIILKNFGFVVETNVNGKPLNSSVYLNNLGKKPVKRSDTETIKWENLQTVPKDQIPKQDNSAKPVTLDFVEDKKEVE